MSEVIRIEKNGIEYFTVEATGESGLSITAIAILCGVSKQAISTLIKNLSTSAPSKWLEPFIGKELDLSSNGVKRGGELKIIKAKVAAAIIRHYAIERKLEKAIIALSMFSDAGITLFIQRMTGWQPPKQIQHPKVLLPVTANTQQREPSLEEINLLFSQFNKLDIKPEFIESAKLTAIANSIPRLAIAAEEGKRLISAHMKTIEVPIAPRKLGQLIAKKHNLLQAPSAQKVNIALTEAGLQYLDNEKKWQLTEAGENFGQKQFDTAKNSHKTIVCLRWFPKVLAQIEKYFLEQFQK